MFCNGPVRHQDTLFDGLAPAFENGNRVADLRLSCYFPGHADGILKVIRGFERVLRAVIHNVELRQSSSPANFCPEARSAAYGSAALRDKASARQAATSSTTATTRAN
jgi:hypothetical protein